MLFFSNNKKIAAKNFSHCYGCGLCTLVCPVWQQTHDVSCTPHGHAKAMQFGGDINVKGLFECVLCGACESVCPENIAIMDMLIELRINAANNQTGLFFLQNKQGFDNKKINSHQTLLLADNTLLSHKTLSGQLLLDWVLELLNGAGNSNGTVEQAHDNGSDISQALQVGVKIAANRKEEFLDSVKSVSKLIVSDGLVKRTLQQWLPNIEITSLGYALSSLLSIQKKLGARDLYIIESQAYNTDFSFMVAHYDALRRSSGCVLNLDLQRLAMPTGGIGADIKQAYKNAPKRTMASFDVSKQGQWILQDLDIERIVVESVEDGIVMRSICEKPIIHVSELAGND